MFISIVEALSIYAIPIVVLIFVSYGLFKKIKVYEVFTEGAKEGFNTAIRIIPFVVAMMTASSVFRASGAMDIIGRAISPVTDLLKIPVEVLPLALVRPLGGSRGVMTEIVNSYGPQSLIGRTVSVMMGSTDTTFYILSVYFGSVAIKKHRHAVSVGLIGDLVGMLSAIYITRIFFL